MATCKKVPPDEWARSVPAGMRALKQWVAHRNKKPEHPVTGAAAKVNDPATWGTFDEARAAYARTLDDATAGVGFVFTESTGLVFVDFDHVLDKGGPRADLDPEVRALIEACAAATYVEVSPSGTGLHALLAGKLPEGVAHRRQVGEAAVEVYDRARYATVTGLSASRVPLAAAPEVLARIVAFGGVRDREVATPAPAEPERYEEIAEALSHLDPDMSYPDWLRVGMALKSGLGRAGFALFEGWSKDGAKYVPGEPAEKWRSFHGSGVGLGTIIWMAQQAGWERDGKYSRPEDVFTVEGGRPRIADRDLVPPGLAGEIAEWVHRTAAVPSRAAAVAAALIAVSAASRNRFEVESRGPDALNLYLGLIGPTGCGKEGARIAVKALAEAGEFADQLVESMASGPALLKALEARPERALLVDEWGHVLREALRSGSDSNPVASFVKELLTLYGLGRSYYAGKCYADDRRNIDRIERPYVNLLATTTLDTMVEALSGEWVKNGFVNRQVFVYVDDEPPEPRFMRAEPVPERIVGALRKLGSPFTNNDGGAPRPVRFSDEAKAAFLAFYKDAQDRGDLWRRAAQNAQRVAAILAVADESEAIRSSDFAWAERFIRWSVERTEHELEASMADSPFHRECKRALRYIRQANDYADDARWGGYCRRGLMPKGQLTRLMKMRARDLGDVLVYLRDSGAVEETAEQKVTLYRAA